MTHNVERLKELEGLVAEQESLIQRMIVRGTPNQAAEDHLRRLKQELAQIKSSQVANRRAV
jgi:uncharacterized coiled-coil protein SlyX